MNFDYQKARNFLNQKKKEKKERYFKFFEKASDDFQKILNIIVKKYNPDRVYQWGSLLNKNSFRDYSDIDIAVEGVESAETFFNMYKDIESVTDFPVDLVHFEKIEQEFRDIIKMKGKIVYERKI